MKRRSLQHSVVSILVLALVVAAIGPAATGGARAQTAGPTAVNSCMTITDPGEYELIRDITNSEAGTCIDIRANDVRFDGDGHIVDGVDTQGTFGVRTGGSGALSNVTVTDVVTTNWGIGIDYQDVTEGRIADVTADSNFLAGVRLLRTTDSLIENSAVTETGVGFDLSYRGEGVRIQYGAGNTVQNILAEDNYQDGIRVLGSSDNTVRNIVSRSNHQHGVWIDESSHENTVVDSRFVRNDRDGMTIRQDSHRNRLIDNVVVGNGLDSLDGDGLEILDGDDNVVRGNVFANHTDDGMTVQRSHRNRIVDNVMRDNTYNGIRLVAPDNTVVDNEITDNDQQDVYLDAEDNTVNGNTVRGTVYLGVEAESNLIYDNLINSGGGSAPVTIASGAGSNTWNVEPRSGENVVGGDTVAGNYYANDAGTGFSQTCEDADGDGLCDSAHRLGAGNTDDAPLTDPADGSGPVPIIDGQSPTDPDGDGLYEDVDGDGDVTYDDVVTFFEHFDDSAVREYGFAYDFDGIEGVTYSDVVALFGVI